jgi:hypothetical protein
MPNFSPIARSPIATGMPITRLGDWEVSPPQTTSAMRLLDLTPCVKLLLRGSVPSPLRDLLPAFGYAKRPAQGQLIIGAIPGEWLLIGQPDAAAQIHQWAGPAGDPSTILIDYSHALVLLRLTGEHSARLLAKLCAINFSPAAFPHGRAVRSSAARVPCTIVRDDLAGSHDPSASTPSPLILSYLLMAERQAGQYLFDSLMDAGSEYHLAPDGFSFD